MIRSNYVLAGFETVVNYHRSLLKDRDDRFDSNFTEEQLSKSIGKMILGGLHSFGQNFSGKKTYTNYIKSEVKLFEACKNCGMYNDIQFIADSGGFQASIGRLKKHETQILIDLYYEFLEYHHEWIDRAFVLDLPPGPGCELFDSFDDVYKYNMDTYTRAFNLPVEARNKIVYIHHFRTPKLWDIYTKILNEPGMFEAFQYFATGGIIANMASDTAIPCIIYVIPLIPVLKKAIEAGQKSLKFHILGGAGFRDILFYEIFQKFIKEKHDVEVEISYDSSGLFKGLMRGRFLLVVEDGILKKIDLKSDSLDLRKGSKRTNQESFAVAINNMAKYYDFKEIDMSAIYNDKTDTFFDDIRFYAALYSLHIYSEIQTMMREEAQILYDLYVSGEEEEFNHKAELVTRKLNQGKISRKQKAKSNSIINSLKMLDTLDENYCKYLVDKHLAKDEFIELDATKRILTI